MLTYDIFKNSQQPLYIALYEQIKNDIKCNKLTAFEKLPSKRNLSKHLNISVITVENAYNQLLSEGYIFSIEKKGYFVAKLNNILIENASLKENKVSIEKEEQQIFSIDLSKNQCLTENFPFSVWAKLTRKILAQQDIAILQRQNYKGTEKLRIAIADFLYHYRGMTVDKEQIIIGAGTEQLYSMIAGIIGRDKIIAIEEPGYNKIAEIYKYNKIDFLRIPMESDGLNLNFLAKSKATAVHISPAHHFPTGIITPIAKRIELLNWAEANGKEERYIIEDDYDSEFRFMGKPIPTMQSIDNNGRVIYVNTFSKSLSPAIRISYMILPKNLINKADKILSFLSCAVSSLEQYTLAKFISNGHFERHINKMTKVYKLKRDKIIKSIEMKLNKNDFEILEEDAGLHFILKIKTDKSDYEIKKNAENKGMKINFLSEYFSDKSNCQQHLILVNYTGIEDDKIDDAVNILSKIY